MPPLALSVFASDPSIDSLYPRIHTLDIRNIAFKQYLADVEENRRRLTRLERFGSTDLKDDFEASLKALTIYVYTLTEQDDLFSLAARCNIPYSALSSINRIRNPEQLKAGSDIFLPSVPALYVPSQAVSDMELLLQAARQDAFALELMLHGPDGSESFAFFPGDDFSPTERAFFLNAAFRYPLPVFRISSGFGYRENPVTGTYRLHEGMDLAAPEGTEVYASRDGVVEFIGEDEIYGKYIIIAHDGGWSSLYGHLSFILADLRKTVQSGSLIGRVGSTGQSTGPHLHFELRRNGIPRNPAEVLPSRGLYR